MESKMLLPLPTAVEADQQCPIQYLTPGRGLHLLETNPTRRRYTREANQRNDDSTGTYTSDRSDTYSAPNKLEMLCQQS